MYSSLPESPQGAGDLIGLAFRIVRRNIGTIFKFILVPSIFTLASGVAFQWVFSYGAAAVSESRNFGTAAEYALGFVATMVIFAISWWILGIRLLALTRTVLGFSPNLEDALQYMNRRKWALAGIYLLGVVLMMGAIVCWGVLLAIGVFAGAVASAGSELGRVLITGLIGLVSVSGMIATVAVYLLASHIAYCVLACENETVATVIGRSLQLTFKYFWRAFAFGLLFVLAFTIISYPLSLPVAAATFIDALQHQIGNAASGLTSSYKPPLYLLVLTQGWEGAMGIVLRPLVVFAFGLFYYDLRLRSEGLDIKRKLETLRPQPVK